MTPSFPTRRSSDRFTWYLLDREIAQPFLPDILPPDLSKMFENPASAFALFDWLRTTFNGDLFPMDDPGAERESLSEQHLSLIRDFRSEEHTSELQSLMRISYAVFCLQKKKN